MNGMDIELDEIARDNEEKRCESMNRLIVIDENAYVSDTVRDEISDSVNKLCNYAYDETVMLIEKAFDEDNRQFFLSTLAEILPNEIYNTVKDDLIVTEEESEKFLSLAFEGCEIKYQLFYIKMKRVEELYPEAYQWVLGMTHLTFPTVDIPKDVPTKTLETIKMFLGLTYDENMLDIETYKRLMGME